MNEKNLKDFLKKENLTLIQLSKITNTPLATVQKWGKSSKVPTWLTPFIINYYKSKELDELKAALQIITKIINKV